MKKTLVFSALAALVLSACSKESTTDYVSEGCKLEKVTVKATFENTKTYIEDLKVKFTDGDMLAVYDGTAIRTFTYREEVAGTVYFDGEIEVGATELYAVFPYEAMLGVSEGKINFRLNNKQKIGEFLTCPVDAIVGVAKATGGSRNLNFKNVSSLLAINVDRSDVAQITVRAAGSYGLVGEASVDPDDIDNTISAGKSTILYIDPVEGEVFGEGTTYYAGILPCTMDGFTVGVGMITGAQTGFLGTDKSCTFARNHGYNIDMADFGWASFGTPYLDEQGTSLPDSSFVFGKEVSKVVKLPYTGCTKASVLHPTVGISGDGAEGLGASSKVEIAAGSGTIDIAMSGTPKALGRVTITPRINGAATKSVCYGRVKELPPFNSYVTWNFWGLGFTRSTDFVQLVGSWWDHCWTNYGADKTKAASTNPYDHYVYCSEYTSDITTATGPKMSAVSSNKITAAGTVTGPKSISGVKGYTFNPGVQIQGLTENDYFIFKIPVKSLASGTKITVTSSLGAAKAAAGYFYLDYSLDQGANWTRFGNMEEYEDSKKVTTHTCHYRATYPTDDPTSTAYRYYYDAASISKEGVGLKGGRGGKWTRCYEFTLPKALSGSDNQLWFRLLSDGYGNGGDKTTGGWTDVKYFEVGFGDRIEQSTN